ncbi:MAG: hypothetical protein WBA97_10325 [Actinophytocola sp.]|uniref:MaoC family dehydratase n=1 Tax=Actinophytocola sp. TaxID=1872138 RepID=UPI003C7440EB
MSSGPALTAGVARTGRLQVTGAAIRRFAQLTGDAAQQHTLPMDSRLMAHGLYVASLAGSLLSECGFVGRRTTLDFLAPVWEGDVLEATVTIRRAVPAGRLGTSVEADFIIHDQAGQAVLAGTAAGLLPLRRHDGAQ